MKKRTVAIVVWLVSAVIALAVGIFALSQKCGHDWDNMVVIETVDATCTKEGSETRECSRCKERETKSLPKKAHVEKTEITKQATCTQTGVETTFCTVCNTVLDTKTIEKEKHNYTIRVEDECVEATCTTEGKDVYKCKTCTATEERTVNVLPHTWEDVPAQEEATCVIPAYTAHKVCTVCGETEGYEELIPAHLDVNAEEGWDVVQESTCSTSGYKQQYCEICKEMRTVDLPTLEHNFVEMEGKTATCTEDGYSAHKKCSECGKLDGYEVYKKTNHDFNDDGYCTAECGAYTYIFTAYKDGYKLSGIVKYDNDNRTTFIIPSTYNEKNVIAIGDFVFSDFDILEKVVLSENIVEIGKSAFKNCNNLTTIEGGDKVETVGQSAFEGCEKLSSVNFVSVKTIGESAFEGCAGLTSVNLKNVETIGDSAFSKCVKIESVQLDKATAIGVTAFKGCTALANVEIAYIEGMTIGERAFEGCSNLEKVTLPYIGLEFGDGKAFGSIFGSNDNVPAKLKSVEILNATSVPDSAFEGVTSLQNILLPVSCVEFGASAFKGCIALNAVYFGEAEKNTNNFSNVTKLCENVFAGCKFVNLVLPFLGEDGTLGYFYDGNTNVSSTLTKVTVKNVETLVAVAFSNCENLTTIDLPAVKNVGEYAFAGCGALTKVTIPNVKTIGESAFNGCSVLNSVNAETGFDFSNVTSIGVKAFAGCETLTELTVAFLGESVGTTGNRNLGYFFGADGTNDGVPQTLTNVTVLNANTEDGQKVGIKDGAFEDCSSLVTLYIPEVPSIGANAFNGCTAIKNIYYGENTDANVFVAENKLLTKIGESAFEGCYTNNDSVTMVLPFIGEEVDDENAFGYIFGGNENVPTSLKQVEITAGTVVSASAFAGCTSIKNIILPETIETVKTLAFSGCEKLEEVTFSVTEGSDGALKTIETQAFYNCSALTKIHLPNSTETIEEATFEGCRNIQQMTLPFLGYSVDGMGAGTNTVHFGYIFGENVSTTDQYKYVPNNKNGLELTFTKATSITAQAFKGCASITKITLPVSVKEIGEEAFKDCSSLTKVVFDGVEGDNFNKWTVSVIENNTFDGCGKLSELILPASVKEIKNSAFNACQALSTFRTAVKQDDTLNAVVGGGVKPNVLDVSSIGDQAFQDAFAKKETLELKNVSMVGERAFRRVRLSSVTFDDSCSLENFSTFVFENSTYVQKVKLPGELRKINIGTFWACTNLTSFEMPSNIQEICASAFYGCTALTISGKDYNNDGRADNVLEFTNAITVGEKAFYECKNLEEVIFNNSNTYYTNNHPNTTIGKYAFGECSGLIRVYLKAWYYEAGSDDAGNNYWLEEGVAVIESLAFSGAGGKNGKILTVCGNGVLDDGTSWDDGWSDDFLQGAKVPNGKTYNGNVSYDDYLAYRDYCVKEGGYATWAEYQEYLSSQSQNP